MKLLELEKRWTGDGYGDAGARIFKQIKRNDKVAMYQRVVESSGKTEGFEVFLIKVRHKGDKLPGGMVEAEDREVYPSANSFGKTAWHIYNRPFAEHRFEELTAKGIADAEAEDTEVEAPAKTFNIPVGDFTTKELAAFNNIQYPIAFLWLKDAVASGQVKKVGERKIEGQRGKASTLYAKAT